MTGHGEHPPQEADEFEFADGVDFDIESFDETEINDEPGRQYRKNAWQQVERYAESKRLRDQLSDWDEWENWDDYFA